MEAGRLRESINSGRDPAADKLHEIEQRIERRSLGSLGDLIDLYISDLETDGKRTAPEVKRIKDKDIPVGLLSRPAHLINKENILDILTPVAQRGARVHNDNVRAYLRAAFELGLNAESMTRWRGRCAKFDLQHNPVATVKRSAGRRPTGQRSLSQDEVRQFWTSDQLARPMLLALRLLIATGQRVEEVLHATWDEFDQAQMLWTIPGERRKTRGHSLEPHLVPLTAFHSALLSEIKNETSNDRYLFPAKGGQTPRRYDVLTNAVRKYVLVSGMKCFSPRDMRRTFKTITGSMGLSLEMRNRLQGHAMTDVGSVHYDRYDYLSEKREAMRIWTNGLTNILGAPE
jgi:integrase